MHDWRDLDDASEYLRSNCKKYARLGLHVKEKYGTMRVSTTCAYISEYDFLHHIVYPGYYYYHWPSWFRVWIDWPIGRILGVLGIIWLIQKYQKFVLKLFWKRAAKKWSHISKEILDEYEWELGEDR